MHAKQTNSIYTVDRTSFSNWKKELETNKDLTKLIIPGVQDLVDTDIDEFIKLVKNSKVKSLEINIDYLSAESIKKLSCLWCDLKALGEKQFEGTNIWSKIKNNLSSSLENYKQSNLAKKEEKIISDRRQNSEISAEGKQKQNELAKRYLTNIRSSHNLNRYKDMADAIYVLFFKKDFFSLIPLYIEAFEKGSFDDIKMIATLFHYLTYGLLTDKKIPQQIRTNLEEKLSINYSMYLNLFFLPNNFEELLKELKKYEEIKSESLTTVNILCFIVESLLNRLKKMEAYQPPEPSAPGITMSTWEDLMKKKLFDQKNETQSEKVLPPIQERNPIPSVEMPAIETPEYPVNYSYAEEFSNAVNEKDEQDMNTQKGEPLQDELRFLRWKLENQKQKNAVLMHELANQSKSSPIMKEQKLTREPKVHDSLDQDVEEEQQKEGEETPKEKGTLLLA